MELPAVMEWLWHSRISSFAVDIQGMPLVPQGALVHRKNESVSLNANKQCFSTNNAAFYLTKI
jgi:hypothetical protein